MEAASKVEQVAIEDVDLMDAAWYSEGPPHELYARMRDEAPVRWNDTADGQGFWSLTRRADIYEVSRDNETFSSHAGGIFLNPDQVLPLDLTRNLLLYKDPPDHTKFRKILQPVFSAKAIRGMEDEIRARITRVIDEVIEAGSCDFVKDVAVPVPLGVLCQLMGLPDDEMPRLLDWTHRIEEAQLATEGAGATETFVEMAGFIKEQIDRQVEVGGDSLVTRLRAAEVEGDQLTDDEILVFFGLLVFAGNDTTRNTASNGTLALLHHRDQWDELRSDPELIPQAVEEILRYTSVVNYFCRTATRDTQLGDERISEGDKVVMWYTSASRDDQAAKDPRRFDVHRAEQDHSAFGGGGRHFCLGNNLARLELRILFEELTRRMPDLEVDGTVQRLSSAWANSLTSMPVTFSPGQREAA